MRNIIGTEVKNNAVDVVMPKVRTEKIALCTFLCETAASAETGLATIDGACILHNYIRDEKMHSYFRLFLR